MSRITPTTSVPPDTGKTTANSGRIREAVASNPPYVWVRIGAPHSSGAAAELDGSRKNVVRAMEKLVCDVVSLQLTCISRNA